MDAGIGSNPPAAAREGEQRAYFYSGNAYQQSIHQVVDSDSGIYRVEFWARNYNTAPNIARAEVAVPGSETVFADIALSSDWRHYILDNISANGNIDVGFYVNSPGGTIVHIDGVKLIKVN